MWHNIKDVAQHHGLDVDSFYAFTKFVFSHKLDENSMIHTWDVNDAVKSFKEHLP